MLLIQEALGDKTGTIIQSFATFVAGFVIGFTRGWRLALVILSVVPLLAICGAFMARIMASLSTKGQAAYASAGAVAEEALSSMRTVSAFGAEQHELDRYTVRLEHARKENTKKGLTTGVGIGTTLLIMMCSYGLSFWYGSTLVNVGVMSAEDVVTTFFGAGPRARLPAACGPAFAWGPLSLTCTRPGSAWPYGMASAAIIMGAMAIGQGAPNIASLFAGTGAAYKVFQVVCRTPEIDSLSEAGVHVSTQAARKMCCASARSQPRRSRACGSHSYTADGGEGQRRVPQRHLPLPVASGRAGAQGPQLFSVAWSDRRIGLSAL